MNASPEKTATLVRLSDYRAPAWRVESVELEFDLGIESTELVSRLLLRRDPGRSRWTATRCRILPTATGPSMTQASVVLDAPPEAVRATSNMQQSELTELRGLSFERSCAHQLAQDPTGDARVVTAAAPPEMVAPSNLAPRSHAAVLLGTRQRPRSRYRYRAIYDPSERRLGCTSGSRQSHKQHAAETRQRPRSRYRYRAIYDPSERRLGCTSGSRQSHKQHAAETRQRPRSRYRYRAIYDPSERRLGCTSGSRQSHKQHAAETRQRPRSRYRYRAIYDPSERRLGCTSGSRQSHKQHAAETRQRPRSRYRYRAIYDPSERRLGCTSGSRQSHKQHAAETRQRPRSRYRYRAIYDPSERRLGCTSGSRQSHKQHAAETRQRPRSRYRYRAIYDPSERRLGCTSGSRQSHKQHAAETRQRPRSRYRYRAIYDPSERRLGCTSGSRQSHKQHAADSAGFPSKRSCAHQLAQDPTGDARVVTAAAPPEMVAPSNLAPRSHAAVLLGTRQRPRSRYRYRAIYDPSERRLGCTSGSRQSHKQHAAEPSGTARMHDTGPASLRGFSFERSCAHQLAQDPTGDARVVTAATPPEMVAPSNLAPRSHAAVLLGPSGTARMRDTGPASAFLRKALVCISLPQDPTGDARVVSAATPPEMVAPPSNLAPRSHEPSCSAPQAVLRKALVCISLPQDPTGDARVVSAATPPEMVAPPSNLAPRSHEPSCSGLGINDIATRPRASHEHAFLRKALVCISLPQDPTGDARVVSAATPPEMVAPPSNLAPRSHEPSCSGLGINDIATRPRASHEHAVLRKALVCISLPQDPTGDARVVSAATPPEMVAPPSNLAPRSHEPSCSGLGINDIATRPRASHEHAVLRKALVCISLPQDPTGDARVVSAATPPEMVAPPSNLAPRSHEPSCSGLGINDIATRPRASHEHAVLRKALVCISLPQDPTGDARVVSAATPPEMVAPPSNLAPRSHEPSCSGLGINDIATRPRASHEHAVLRKALVCISLPQDPTGDARVVSAATPPEMVAPPSNLAPRSHEPSCSGLGINDIATRPRASHEHAVLRKALVCISLPQDPTGDARVVSAATPPEMVAPPSNLAPRSHEPSCSGLGINDIATRPRASHEHAVLRKALVCISLPQDPTGDARVVSAATPPEMVAPPSNLAPRSHEPSCSGLGINDIATRPRASHEHAVLRKALVCISLPQDPTGDARVVSAATPPEMVAPPSNLAPRSHEPSCSGLGINDIATRPRASHEHAVLRKALVCISLPQDPTGDARVVSAATPPEMVAPPSNLAPRSHEPSCSGLGINDIATRPRASHEHAVLRKALVCISLPQDPTGDARVVSAATPPEMVAPPSNLAPRSHEPSCSGLGINDIATRPRASHEHAVLRKALVCISLPQDPTGDARVVSAATPPEMVAPPSNLAPRSHEPSCSGLGINDIATRPRASHEHAVLRKALVCISLPQDPTGDARVVSAATPPEMVAPPSNLAPRSHEPSCSGLGINDIATRPRASHEHAVLRKALVCISLPQDPTGDARVVSAATPPEMVAPPSNLAPRSHEPSCSGLGINDIATRPRASHEHAVLRKALVCISLPQDPTGDARVVSAATPPEMVAPPSNLAPRSHEPSCSGLGINDIATRPRASHEHAVLRKALVCISLPQDPTGDARVVSAATPPEMVAPPSNLAPRSHEPSCSGLGINDIATRPRASHEHAVLRKALVCISLPQDPTGDARVVSAATPPEMVAPPSNLAPRSHEPSCSGLGINDIATRPRASHEHAVLRKALVCISLPQDPTGDARVVSAATPPEMVAPPSNLAPRSHEPSCSGLGINDIATRPRASHEHAVLRKALVCISLPQDPTGDARVVSAATPPEMVAPPSNLAPRSHEPSCSGLGINDIATRPRASHEHAVLRKALVCISLPQDPTGDARVVSAATPPEMVAPPSNLAPRSHEPSCSGLGINDIATRPRASHEHAVLRKALVCISLPQDPTGDARVVSAATPPEMVAPPSNLAPRSHEPSCSGLGINDIATRPRASHEHAVLRKALVCISLPQDPTGDARVVSAATPPEMVAPPSNLAPRSHEPSCSGLGINDIATRPRASHEHAVLRKALVCISLPQDPTGDARVVSAATPPEMVAPPSNLAPRSHEPSCSGLGINDIATRPRASHEHAVLRKALVCISLPQDPTGDARVVSAATPPEMVAPPSNLAPRSHEPSCSGLGINDIATRPRASHEHAVLRKALVCISLPQDPTGDARVVSAATPPEMVAPPSNLAPRSHEPSCSGLGINDIATRPRASHEHAVLRKALVCISLPQDPTGDARVVSAATPPEMVAPPSNLAPRSHEPSCSGLGINDIATRPRASHEHAVLRKALVCISLPQDPTGDARVVSAATPPEMVAPPSNLAPRSHEPSCSLSGSTTSRRDHVQATSMCCDDPAQEPSPPTLPRYRSRYATGPSMTQASAFLDVLRNRRTHKRHAAEPSGTARMRGTGPASVRSTDTASLFPSRLACLAACAVRVIAPPARLVPEPSPPTLPRYRSRYATGPSMTQASAFLDVLRNRRTHKRHAAEPSGTARMRGTGPASVRSTDTASLFPSRLACLAACAVRVIAPPARLASFRYDLIRQSARKAGHRVGVTPRHDDKGRAWMEQAGSPQAVLRKALVCISLPQDPTGDARVVSAATPPEMVAPPSNLAPRSHEPSCSGLGINDIATRPRASHEHAVLRKALVCISLPQDPTGDARVVSAATPPEMVAPPSNLAPRSHEPSCSGLGINDIATRPRASHEHAVLRKALVCISLPQDPTGDARVVSAATPPEMVAPPSNLAPRSHEPSCSGLGINDIATRPRASHEHAVLRKALVCISLPQDPTGDARVVSAATPPEMVAPPSNLAPRSHEPSCSGLGINDIATRPRASHEHAVLRKALVCISLPQDPTGDARVVSAATPPEMVAPPSNLAPRSHEPSCSGLGINDIATRPRASHEHAVLRKALVCISLPQDPTGDARVVSAATPPEMVAPPSNLAPRSHEPSCSGLGINDIATRPRASHEHAVLRKALVCISLPQDPTGDARVVSAATPPEMVAPPSNLAPRSHEPSCSGLGINDIATRPRASHEHAVLRKALVCISLPQDPTGDARVVSAATPPEMVAPPSNLAPRSHEPSCSGLGINDIATRPRASHEHAVLRKALVCISLPQDPTGDARVVSAATPPEMVAPPSNLAPRSHEPSCSGLGINDIATRPRASHEHAVLRKALVCISLPQDPTGDARVVSAATPPEMVAPPSNLAPRSHEPSCSGLGINDIATRPRASHEHAVLRKALVCISLPQDPTGDARVVSAATQPEMVAPPSNLAPRSHEPSCSGLGINDIATRPRASHEHAVLRKALVCISLPQDPTGDARVVSAATPPEMVAPPSNLAPRSHEPSCSGLGINDIATRPRASHEHAVLRKALVCISLPQDPTGDARVVSAATPPEMVAPPSNLAPRSHEPSCSGLGINDIATRPRASHEHAVLRKALVCISLPQDPTGDARVVSAATPPEMVAPPSNLAPRSHEPSCSGLGINDIATRPRASHEHAVLRKALVCISLPQDPTGDARVVSAATQPEMVAPPSNLAPRSHEPSCSGLGINDIATRPRASHEHAVLRKALVCISLPQDPTGDARVVSAATPPEMVAPPSNLAPRSHEPSCSGLGINDIATRPRASHEHAVLRKALVCISLPQDPTGDARVVSAATPPEMVAPPSNLAPRSHEPSCSGLGINDIATRPRASHEHAVLRKALVCISLPQDPTGDARVVSAATPPEMVAPPSNLAPRSHEPSCSGLGINDIATRPRASHEHAVLRKALVCISLPQDPTGDARVVSAATPPEMVAPPSNLAPRSHEPSCSGLGINDIATRPRASHEHAVLRKALVCISLPQDPTGDARVVSAATPPEMVAPPSNLAPRSHEPSCSGLGINDIATRPRASHEHVLR
ncbi:MAG: hypothetical protein WDW36_008587 [Sanguina aurantia]